MIHNNVNAITKIVENNQFNLTHNLQFDKIFNIACISCLSALI